MLQENPSYCVFVEWFSVDLQNRSARFCLEDISGGFTNNGGLKHEGETSGQLA